MDLKKKAIEFYSKLYTDYSKRKDSILEQTNKINTLNYFEIKLMQKLISLPNFPPESGTYVIIPDLIDENKFELIYAFIKEYKDEKLNNVKNNILDVNPLFD